MDDRTPPDTPPEAARETPLETPPDAAPKSPPRRPARVKERLLRLKHVLIVVAGAGTVVGGLAGYLQVWQALKDARLLPGATPQATAGTPSPAASAAALSIALLPLADQTGDPAKRHVAAALTSSLTTDLQRIPEAVVVPPLAAAAWQARQLTLPELGAQAGVRFVLQGGVMASDDRLRVQLQLTEAATGQQLWGGSFEGNNRDLFALQDQVTAQVGAVLRPKMVLAAMRERERSAEAPRAADLMLQAEALALAPRTAERLQQQEALYAQVASLEPGNLRARERLAGTRWQLAVDYGAVLRWSLEDNRRRLLEAADLARSVHDARPDWLSPHYIQADAALAKGDGEAALRFLRRATEIEPRSHSAWNNLGRALLLLGRPDEADVALQRALAIPSYLPQANTLANLADVALQRGDLESALQWARRAVEANDRFHYPRMQVVAALGLLGQAEPAREQARELLRVAPDFRLDALSTRLLNLPLSPQQQALRERILAACVAAGLPR